VYETSLALGEDPARFASTLIPPRDWSLDRTNALVNRFANTTTYLRGLMLLIGELINATRKKVGAAVERETRSSSATWRCARRRGADMLDVNGGIAGREAESLEWLINVVQEATEVPLSVDSSDSDALRRTLPLCKQRRW